MLNKHIELLLENRQNLRFLFPLCGKAWDLRWIASLGHQVLYLSSVPIKNLDDIVCEECSLCERANN